MSDKYYQHLGFEWRLGDLQLEGELKLIGPFLSLTLPAFILNPQCAFSELLSGNYHYVWRGSDGWVLSLVQKHDYNQGLLSAFDLTFSSENGSQTCLTNVPKQLCFDVIIMLGGSFSDVSYPLEPLSQAASMSDISDALLLELTGLVEKVDSLQKVQVLINRVWKTAQIENIMLPLRMYLTALGLAEIAVEYQCPNVRAFAEAVVMAEERIDPLSQQELRQLLKEYRSAKLAGLPVDLLV